MSYAYVNNRAIIIRLADKKIIAPYEDINDPDLLEYLEWLNAGNELPVVEPEDVGVP